MESSTTPLADALHRASLRSLLALAEAPPSDVPAFAGWLRPHRLAPWAADRARRLGPAWAALATELRDDLLRAAGVEARRSAWLTAFFGGLGAAGIRPVLFKGLGVAHTLYEAPHLRPLGDVDLLVRPHELERAVAVARAHGFAELAADPAIAAYQREEGYAVQLMHPAHGPLELHHRLYRDCEDAFVDAMLARTTPLRVLGVEAELLAPADLWLVLATHWITDNAERCWLWLLDLALLGRSVAPEDMASLARVAQLHGLQVFALGALRGLEVLFGLRFEHASPVAALSVELTPRERSALSAVDDLAAGLPLDGDRILSVRRLAGRPLRGDSGGLVRWIFCHPGVVCEELNVHSGSSLFLLHRCRHATTRLLRGLRALSSSLIEGRRRVDPA